MFYDLSRILKEGVTALLGGFGREVEVRRLPPWLRVTEVPLMEPGVYFVSIVEFCSIELLLDVAISLRLYFPEGCPFRLLVMPFPVRWSNVLSGSCRLFSMDGIY